LEGAIVPSSRILPWSGFDHRPIVLDLSPPVPLGPISFRFNLRWVEDPSFLGVVAAAWNFCLQGSPIFIWEQKLKATKQAIREWVKLKTIQEKKEIQDFTIKMEEVRVKMESAQITPSLFIKD